MFCHKCGFKNRIEAAFCRQCGSQLGDNQSRPSGLERPVYILSGIRKHPKKIILFLGAIILILTLAFPAKLYFNYFIKMRAADAFFAQGKYTDAVAQLESIDQKGLYSRYKNNLSDAIAKYQSADSEDKDFQKAKTDEQTGDLDEARVLLIDINNKGNYPRINEVTQELNVINDKLTTKAQTEAAAQVASAQEKAQTEAANRKKAQEAADEAAASAAANAAAAEQAQQEAARQAAAAQAAQAEAAAAQQAAAQAAEIARQQAQQQDVAYIDALSKAAGLENTANTDINESGTAYAASLFSTASADVLVAESDCNAALAALPGTYPTKFETVNEDILSAIRNLNSAATDLFNAYENTDIAMYDTGISYQDQAISAYNRIKPDLASLGY